VLYQCSNGKILNLGNFIMIFCSEVWFKDALQLKNPKYEVRITYEAKDHGYQIEEFETLKEAQRFLNWLSERLMAGNYASVKYSEYKEGV